MIEKQPLRRADVLIDRLRSEGVSVKALNVGSTGAFQRLSAVNATLPRAPSDGLGNRRTTRLVLNPRLELVSGSGRPIVHRKGDPRFEGALA